MKGRTDINRYIRKWKTYSFLENRKLYHNCRRGDDGVVMKRGWLTAYISKSVNTQLTITQGGEAALVTVKQVIYPVLDVDEIRVMAKGLCHLLRLAFLSVFNKVLI